MLQPHLTLNCGGRLVWLEEPVLMGILNVTPDSFFDGGRYSGEVQILKHAEKMLAEGATFVDVGGMSSRPGADFISEKEELERVVPIIASLKKAFPEALISVDTWRSEVAKAAADAGATMINDISAGSLDEKMFETVAKLGLPYVLMHMQGTPQNMQQAPHYDNATLEILDFFIWKIAALRALGVRDIILDPGFGFGKTVEHNYEILTRLHVFKMLDYPVLAGISRKSMICKVLKVNPEHALNGTTALHMVALQQGAKILRVHDVREAKEAIALWRQVRQAENFENF
jgi:dihydropteroate synthase